MSMSFEISKFILARRMPGVERGFSVCQHLSHWSPTYTVSRHQGRGDLLHACNTSLSQRPWISVKIQEVYRILFEPSGYQTLQYKIPPSWYESLSYIYPARSQEPGGGRYSLCQHLMAWPLMLTREGDEGAPAQAPGSQPLCSAGIAARLTSSKIRGILLRSH